VSESRTLPDAASGIVRVPDRGRSFSRTWTPARGLPCRCVVKLLFDRGTILIDDLPQRGSSPAQGLVRWDPRIGGYRAPASLYRELLAALEARGEAFCDLVHRAEDLPASVVMPSLRSYQREALRAWTDADRRGIVALPTGSGKTRIALAAAAAVGRSTLCIVPTRVLLEQWRDALERAYPGEIGCYGDGAKRLAPITIATFASAVRQMPQIGNRFELLIVDEAHHAAAFEELFSMSTAPARLGLTATPPRDPEALDTLTRLIGPVAYERSLGALAGAFLAPFELKTIKLPMTDAEGERYAREMGVFRELYGRYRRWRPSGSWAEFVRAAERSDEGRRALAAWRRARRLAAYTEAKRRATGELLSWHTDARALVFTSDNASAYAIARDHLIMPITCDIARKERDAALAKFSSGTLRALVSARVLNEGVDVPDADVAIIVGGSLGEREHVQRIGRLLRPAAGKRALVYELVTRGTAEVGQQARRNACLAADLSA
jgi:superfamily II DNA or RNA helicase